jgi:NADP-dependent 3-hydroxy acid dehydrogenase YdfG
VITGGTSGIGLETAKLMVECGVRTMVINGRNAELGEHARREIASCAPDASVTFVKADVSSAEGAAELFRAVAQLMNAPLEVLVNSTGGDFSPELFHRTPLADLDGIVRHWLSSRIHSCYAALPLMTAGGAIVNVGSDAAKVPTPGEAVIGAAMAGMAMFSRTLAMEAKRQGIGERGDPVGGRGAAAARADRGGRVRRETVREGWRGRPSGNGDLARRCRDDRVPRQFACRPDDRSGHQHQRRDLGWMNPHMYTSFSVS